MNRLNNQAPLARPLHFDALLTPHRSLGRRGFLVVMVLVSGVSFAAGMAFLLMGAWPVFGFFGLDVALIYGAFKLNYRAARAHETVQLSGDELRVRHVAADGRARAWSFQPHWVRVETKPEPGGDLSVHLASHGRRLQIATCLSPDERRDFATALRTALSRLNAHPA